ncbi:MAG: hypothetical protein ACOX6V_00745 [Patescibacteria group bacterium]|jgi:hypothetical protein
MSHMIAGTFKNKELASQAVSELKNSGYTAIDSVSLLTPEEESRKDTGLAVLQGSKGGTAEATSSTVGGTLKDLAMRLVIVPGIGLVHAAGPMIRSRGVSGGVLGALGGGLMLALVSAGFSESLAKNYEKRVKRGETFISIIADGNMETSALEILKKYGLEEAEVISKT